MNQTSQQAILRYRITVTAGGLACLPSVGLFLLFVARVIGPDDSYGGLYSLLGVASWIALTILALRRFRKPTRRLPPWLAILNWLSCIVAGLYGVVLGLLLGGTWTLVFVGIPVIYGAYLLVWEVLPKDPWE